MSYDERLKALESLEGSVERLLGYVAVLEERVQRLEVEKAGLEQELATLRSQVKVSTEEVKVLSAAAALSSDPDKTRRARKLIASLLREIDACIALLQA